MNLLLYSLTLPSKHSSKTTLFSHTLYTKDKRTYIVPNKFNKGTINPEIFLKLKEEMNTIVKKNQKMLKSHIKKPVNLNGSNFDYLESKHNLEDKHMELIERQQRVAYLQAKNIKLSRTLHAKLERKKRHCRLYIAF